MKIRLSLALFALFFFAAIIVSPAYLCPGEEAEIYLSRPVAGAIDAGSFFIVRADMDEIYAFLRRGDILGMSIVSSGNNLSAEGLMKRLGVTRSRRGDIDGKLCYYAYSPLLGGGVKVDGEQVNMQIVQGENCLTAGFPLIMGSY